MIPHHWCRCCRRIHSHGCAACIAAARGSPVKRRGTTGAHGRGRVSPWFFVYSADIGLLCHRQMDAQPVRSRAQSACCALCYAARWPLRGYATLVANWVTAQVCNLATHSRLPWRVFRSQLRLSHPSHTSRCKHAICCGMNGDVVRDAVPACNAACTAPAPAVMLRAGGMLRLTSEDADTRDLYVHGAHNQVHTAHVPVLTHKSHHVTLRCSGSGRVRARVVGVPLDTSIDWQPLEGACVIKCSVTMCPRPLTQPA